MDVFDRGGAGSSTHQGGVYLKHHLFRGVDTLGIVVVADDHHF